MASFTTTEFDAGELSVQPFPWFNWGANNAMWVLDASQNLETSVEYTIVGGAD